MSKNNKQQNAWKENIKWFSDLWRNLWRNPIWLFQNYYDMGPNNDFEILIIGLLRTIKNIQETIKLYKTYNEYEDLFNEIYNLYFLQFLSRMRTFIDLILHLFELSKNKKTLFKKDYSSIENYVQKETVFLKYFLNKDEKRILSFGLHAYNSIIFSDYIDDNNSLSNHTGAENNQKQIVIAKKAYKKYQNDYWDLFDIDFLIIKKEFETILNKFLDIDNYVSKNNFKKHHYKYDEISISQLLKFIIKNISN